MLTFSTVFDWYNLDFLFDFALVCSNHLFVMPIQYTRMGLLEALKHCIYLDLFTEATPDKDPKKGSDTSQSKLFTKEK